MCEAASVSGPTVCVCCERIIADGSLAGGFWYLCVHSGEKQFLKEFIPHARGKMDIPETHMYTDLHFRALGMEPGQSPSFDFKAGHEQVCSWKRYVDVANAVDWNLLTILLHSSRFRELVRDLDEDQWATLLEALEERNISIKPAGYACFPEWRDTFRTALPGQDVLSDDGFPAT